MNLRERLWPKVPEEKWSDHRWQIANRLKGAKGLERLLRLEGLSPEPYLRLLSKYKWASTPYYVSLIKGPYSSDPIALQVLPSQEETRVQTPLSCPDPLSEHKYSPVPGLIHRYRDRVVILVSNRCASYCRHCNRKRTWRKPESLPATNDALNHVLNYIKTHPEIREVLISGGDPLFLSLKRLKHILKSLKDVPNVEVLRIGTRIPVVLPMAVTKELCKTLKAFRPLWLNTQFNHPQEITLEAQKACERLQLSGIPVSNQSVLLKGVNDDLNTMKSLCYDLQKIMVRPYYLFHCDFVEGTDHFRTSISCGIEIIEKMWGHTGGMCIPNYVVDLPGGLGKARLMPSHLKKVEKDNLIFQTFEGKLMRLQID